MTGQDSLTKLVVITLVLFIVYLIIKRRTDKIRRRHDERSKFRHDRSAEE